tara:strand:- start:33 stop:827 length:795 start_codon:yes stop_codon:yes gene_type:complete
MNNNSDDPNCENNIKENLHKYVEEKHIEIENNIKLMENCNEIKKKIEPLDVNVNMKYVDMYNNILLNHKNILNTTNLMNILNKNTEKSIEEDSEIQFKLDTIDEIRKQINDKFIYRFQLCEDYIHYFNETKSEISQLYNMYNSNIIEIVEKNKKYNEMIDFLLEEYNGKFNEYKQKIKIEYPKNYVIQLIVSMIILQDNRSKTNLKFKEYLILELETQKNEIFNQTQLSDKINLNSSIMKECYNMNELINNLNENLEEGDIRYI